MADQPLQRRYILEVHDVVKVRFYVSRPFVFGVFPPKKPEILRYGSFAAGYCAEAYDTCTFAGTIRELLGPNLLFIVNGEVNRNPFRPYLPGPIPNLDK
jgi:hypothetical protein